MNFVVLSSSKGTTFQAVIDAMKSGQLTATCLGLIADRADRGCIAKAKAAGIPVHIVEREKGEDRESYDKKLNTIIIQIAGSEERPVLACLGWMFLFSPWFVNQWKNKILNVHPSLLPKYPGVHAHDEVLAAGDKESGMTIHWIDEGEDTGPVVVQKKCSVLASDTSETLKKRVQELECEWYPKVLQMIETGEVSV